MWKRPRTAEVNPLVDGHTPQYNRAAWVDLLIQFVLGALAILFFVLFVLQINQINPNHCSEDELVDRLWLDVNYSAQEQTAYPLYMDDNGYMIANHLHDGSSTGCDAALHKALVARDQTTATMFDTESTERRRLQSYTLTNTGMKNKKLKVSFTLSQFTKAFPRLNIVQPLECGVAFKCLQNKKCNDGRHKNAKKDALKNCYQATCDTLNPKKEPTSSSNTLMLKVCALTKEIAKAEGVTF